MLKIKTTVTTKIRYSKDGKTFWIEYTEETKSTVLNLCKYALSDIKKGETPFTVNVSEEGIYLNFKVDDEKTKEVYTEIFEAITTPESQL